MRRASSVLHEWQACLSALNYLRFPYSLRFLEKVLGYCNIHRILIFLCYNYLDKVRILYPNLSYSEVRNVQKY